MDIVQLHEEFGDRLLDENDTVLFEDWNSGWPSEKTVAMSLKKAEELLDQRIDFIQRQQETGIRVSMTFRQYLATGDSDGDMLHDRRLEVAYGKSDLDPEYYGTDNEEEDGEEDSDVDDDSSDEGDDSSSHRDDPDYEDDDSIFRQSANHSKNARKKMKTYDDFKGEPLTSDDSDSDYEEDLNRKPAAKANNNNNKKKSGSLVAI